MKIAHIELMDGMLDNGEPGAELLVVLQGDLGNVAADVVVRAVAATLLATPMIVKQVEHPSQADGYDEEPLSNGASVE